MAVIRFIVLLLVGYANLASGVTRRNNSLMSDLVRLVLSRSKFNRSNNESSRITQAPIVKMHLEKTTLPLFFYHTHKQPQEDFNVGLLKSHMESCSGANEIDKKNEKNKDVDDVHAMIGEMEIFEVVPLKMLNAHNYTKEELKKMPDNGESREVYEYLFVESPESQQGPSTPQGSKQK